MLGSWGLYQYLKIDFGRRSKDVEVKLLRSPILQVFRTNADQISLPFSRMLIRAYFQ